MTATQLGIIFILIDINIYCLLESFLFVLINEFNPIL